ncbi:MAG: RNB domain-containing ribonuclease, partial [Ilumatobacter sp.]|nr:RNB domain-containing ribonuclease [Ilumatobacter sp.]
AAMSKGEQRANRAERMALDLAEAVVLRDRVGEVFDAVVVDESERGVEVQIADPAVLVRLSAHRVDPGDTVTVRLEAVDVDQRTVTFQRIG